MKRRRSGVFKLREVAVTERGATYRTFRVTGWLGGIRVRKQFSDRAEALGEKNRLEVQAANTGEVVVRPTRLSALQLAEAETALARLGSRSLSLAVEWFLSTYRPPVSEMALVEAKTAFIAERRQHVRAITLRDYEATLAALSEALGPKKVHEVKTEQLLAFLGARGVGGKRWNNLRGDLHAFFEWCKAAPRQWTQENPAAGVPKFKVARGVPEIKTAAQIRELFQFLEGYTGEYGKPQPAGFMVPYFALATFAGLRPSVVEGEIWKLGGLKDLSRVIDLDLNVIRVGPTVAKTNHVRQITIQPNLREWLLAYPLEDYPIRVPNLKLHVTRVRERCGLKHFDDVLRHTFISMHVAKWKSVGQAAIEAGNSETMIKRHYLNMVSLAEAEAFWAIAPNPASDQ